MQKFKFFTLAILAMLSVNFVWGADITLTIEVGDFTGGSSSSYTVTSWSSNASDGTAISGSSKVILDETAIRFKKSYIYNSTELPGAIKQIRVIKASGSDRSVTAYVSPSALTSATGTNLGSQNLDCNFQLTAQQIAADNRYFYLNMTTNNAYYISSIEIVMEAAATATITKTANLTNFTYEEGSGPSAEQSFTVGGTNLTANITVTAPTNFEVSKSSGSGYASSVTLTQSSGTVSNTTIYVRMKSGLSQGTDKGGDITLSSTGATTQTIAVVGTVTAPSYTVTPQSNNTELGTVSGTTTITASPKECVGYANSAYTVTPTGKATVVQSGNTFTVSNVTDNVTVTINFAELDKDTYEDHLHGNTAFEKCGSYEAPSLPDAAKATTENCDAVHYHFAGWVTDPIFTGTPGTPDDMITAGTNMTSNGRTYIAVWAKEQ